MHSSRKTKRTDEMYLLKIPFIVTLIVLLSCDEVAVLAPHAISNPTNRAEIQSELDNTNICALYRVEPLNDIVQAIDHKVGHSDWGWSCSPNIKDNLVGLQQAKSWQRPKRIKAREDARQYYSGENNFLQGWISTVEERDDLDRFLPYYEEMVNVLGTYYRFTTEQGVGHIGFQGRYVAFSPPLAKPNHTVSTATIRCNSLNIYCFPAFFVSEGKLYPTIFRK